MIEVVKFEAKHLEELRASAASPAAISFLTPEHARTLEKTKSAFTAISDGRVIACAGIVEYWENRAEAWAIFHQDCQKQFLSIHRAVMRFLTIAPQRRIEMAVDVNFLEGHRWAKLLGFKLEAERMRAFTPFGNDCSLYARVRE